MKNIFLVLFVFFLLFNNFFKNNFVYDDELVVKDNVFLQQVIKNPAVIFSSDYFKSSGENTFRPIVTLSYALDYLIWQFNPTGYHLTNFLIHLLNSVLIYLFLIFLFKLFDSGRDVNLLVFSVSAIFLVHPIQTSVINCVGFRDESLYVLFLLISFIFYLKYIEKSKIIFYVFSLFFAFFSFFAKEFAIIILFLILLINIFLKVKKNKSIFLFLGFVGISILYLVILTSWIIPVSNISGLKIDRAYHPIGDFKTTFFTAINIFASYFNLLICPVNLIEERVVDVISSPFNFKFLISLLVILATGLLGIINLKRNKIVFFAIFWFFICLVPVNNFFPHLAHFMADRYLYLAIVGFGLIVALVLEKVAFFNKNIGIAVFFIYLMFLCVLMFQRNYIWKDSLTFWEDRAKYQPMTQRGYASLGHAYLEKEMYDKAIAQLNLGIKSQSDYPDNYHNLGKVYFKLKNFELAEENFKKAIAVDSKFYKAYNDLGRVYLYKNEFDAAFENFTKSLELQPYNLEVYNNLGKLFFLKKEYSESNKYYYKALDLNYHNYYVLNNLGINYFNLGDFKTAKEYYIRSIHEKKDFVDAMVNLAVLYMNQKRYDEAKELLEKAEVVDPKNESVRGNLEVLNEIASLHSQ